MVAETFDLFQLMASFSTRLLWNVNNSELIVIDSNTTQLISHYLSWLIQRGNAAAVLGTIKAKHTDYYG